MSLDFHLGFTFQWFTSSLQVCVHPFLKRFDITPPLFVGPWSTAWSLSQVTDGVQNLEAMEYQPIPALSTALRWETDLGNICFWLIRNVKRVWYFTIRPGVKLQLQGQMACRLGVLLLGPSNVRVLGGEVEDLVDRNNQVVCDSVR